MTDVIVVGAGVGGLYAAHLLQKAGASVAVVEAAPIIGGRIYKDLGADFVHGSIGNLIIDMQKEEGWKMKYLFDIEEPKGEEVLVSEGKLHAYNSELGMKCAEAIARMRGSLHVLPTGIPLDEFFAASLPTGNDDDSRTLHGAGAPHDSAVHKLCEGIVARTWSTNLTTMDAKEVSRVDDEWCYSGDNYILEGGFPQLLNHITKGLDVRTQWKAVRVEVTPQGKVKVSNDKGETLLCSYVVMAVPLPVLKDGDISFSPPMPLEKRQALSVMRMGHATKIAATFSKVFWPTKYTIMITDHERFGQIWMYGEVGARPDTADEFTITAFITGAAATPITAGVVVGGAALESELARSDLNSTAGATRDFVLYLESLFKPVGGVLPIFKKAIIFNWDEHPYIRGAYSYPALGVTLQTKQAVAAPLHDRIFFAGEHAHLHTSGTVQSAMETGKDAAQAIGERLRRKSKL